MIEETQAMVRDANPERHARKPGCGGKPGALAEHQHSGRPPFPTPPPGEAEGIGFPFYVVKDGCRESARRRLTEQARPHGMP